MNGTSQTARKRGVLVVVALIVMLSVLPGVALGETRAGGSVVVEAGETVEGDLTVFAGSVTIEGTVDGDVTAFGGSVRIDGTVTGDVSVSAGSIVLGPGGTITGSLQATTGTAVLAGTVGGDVTAIAGSVELTSTATLGGDLTYDGSLDRAVGATVQGTVTETSSAGFGSVIGVSIPRWLPAAYFFAAGLLAAVLCVGLFPHFSTAVADGIIADPLRSGGAGLLVLVGWPVMLVVFAITIVGIPLAVLGALGYAVALWIASLYGRYAVGEYVLSLFEVDNRWIALLVGFVAVTVLVRVPLLGGVLQLIVVVLGLGAISDVLYRRYRDREVKSEPDEADDSSATSPT
ncbi:MAG: polymer-forming cytoskeletal protein [Halorhabdus sp.]